MAAGSIIIDLLMKTGSFETDTDRAAKALEKFNKKAQEVGKTIGVAISAAVVGAAAAFDQLVKSAADFKDLEETIGASAEDIASLSIAAATAGVSIESVAGATIKLTKGLTGVDDESKAAGAALAALGINIEEFKRLDPVGQYEAVGKALSGFADGAQKTAVAVALFGKTGAEQLRVFKALDEAGGRQVILTQQQIELADAYADKQAKQAATLKAYAQTIAVDALPAFNDFTQALTEVVKAFAGIDNAGKKLAGQSQAAEFAKTAADSLALIVDAGQMVVRIFEAIGKSIGARLAQVASFARGDFAEAIRIGKDAKDEIDSLLSAESFSQKLQKVRDANRLGSLGQGSADLARRGRGPAALPQIDFEGPQKAAKTPKDKLTDADRYLEKLRESTSKANELTAVETLLADVQAGRFKGAKAGQLETALYYAQQVDDAKKLTAQEKELVRQADEMEKKSNELRDAGTDVFKSTRTDAEKYSAELIRLNGLLSAGAIDYDTYGRAIKSAAEQFDDATKKQKEVQAAIDSSLTTNAADAFSDFISGTKSASQAFKQFANSVILDLIRIAAQEAATKLFGDSSKGSGSGFGALLGKIFGSGGSVNSGNGAFLGDYGDAATGLATGTNYVPNDGFRAILHKGEAVVPREYNPAAGGIGGGGDVQIVTPPGVPMTAQVQEEQRDGRRLKKIVLSTMVQDAQDGGVGIKTITGVTGTNRKLARRGR